MIVIGIHGKAQSGKGTTADEMKKYPKIFAEEIGFGDKVKEVAMDLFHLKHDDVYTPEGKSSTLDEFGGISVRSILQKIGTEVGREIYPDIWIYHVQQKIHQLELSKYDSNSLNYRNCAIISDLRFPNEYKALKEMGAYLIKTERPGYEIEESTHSSETSLDSVNDWDFIIRATTEDDVRAHARKIIEIIVEEHIWDADGNWTKIQKMLHKKIRKMVRE